MKRTVKPRPVMPYDYKAGGFVEVPRGEVITHITPYMPYRYPKWLFWKKNKYFIAATTKNKIYLIDPDAQSVTEAT